MALRCRGTGIKPEGFLICLTSRKRDVRNLFCLILALLVAGLFSQEPEFLQQYTQRLSGRIDELTRQAREFEARVQAFGLTRDEAIARFKANPDPVVAGEAAAREADLALLARLERQRANLQGGSELSRLMAMIGELDPEIARATYADFKPAVPVTTQGLVFAMAGFIAGLIVALIVTGILGAIGRALFSSRRVAG